MVVFHLEISRWNRQMGEQSYIYIFLLHRYLITNKMGLGPQKSLAWLPWQYAQKFSEMQARNLLCC